MSSDGLIRPHGGQLIDRVARGAQRDELLARAARAQHIEINPVAASDLELIGTGALSPLTGFLMEADYRRVVEEMRLADGTPWSLPITLAVSSESIPHLRVGAEVALIAPGEAALSDPSTRVLGILSVGEIYPHDKGREATNVYRTADLSHPGVARLMDAGDLLIGGEIWLLNRVAFPQLANFHHDPAQTRRMFAGRGWRTVVGFQTRNPIHRSHEYIQKTALELVDGLFLHPLVGETKADDIPADLRMASYEALLRDYYPPDRVLLGIFPAAMRYAGPREAIFHALCRKNYGCTHFIVGRDHAGVGNFYGPFDAHMIFREFDADELGIQPLFFDNTFYCRRCGGIVSSRTCPHEASYHVVLSGTQVRAMLERGEVPPAEFTRPEVAQVLVDGLRKRREALSGNGERTHAPKKPRVLVIGLDCAEPSLVFDQWRNELPNLGRLMDGGTYGRLESIVPCITVPAWAAMMSSKDPGQLGIYGFHNRADASYARMTIANATSVREPLLWDHLSQAGKQVVLIGVPPAYPPKPVNGISVGCFLTPSTDRMFTYPAGIGDELRALVGEYLVDVPNFRTENKEYLLKQIQDMTDRRFAVIREFIQSKPWDFFMFVEIGVDRIHHGMWKFHDPLHRRHDPSSPFRSAIREYYRDLDSKIGDLLGLVDDNTIVWVVSDHGAKRMDGGFCLNEWLQQEGYLVLKERPKGLTSLEKCEVDWERTTAWGGGGYYGRVFLNVRGREPSGRIDQSAYESVRDELAEKLESLSDHRGEPLRNVAYRPQRIYREVRGIAPDLLVYFGDLHWRAVGSLGHGAIHTFENDTGPDDANHAQEGLFICYNPAERSQGRVVGAHLTDIAPTILRQLQHPVPTDMIGRGIDFAGVRA